MRRCGAPLRHMAPRPGWARGHVTYVRFVIRHCAIELLLQIMMLGRMGYLRIDKYCNSGNHESIGEPHNDNFSTKCTSCHPSTARSSREDRRRVPASTSNRKEWKVRSIFWGPLLSLIPFIIEWWAIRDNIRRVLPLENFPEIKEMATEYAARGLSGALKNVKEMIDWYPDLVPWKPMVERYFMILEIGRNVRGLLKASQGIERTVIKKTFAEYDGRDISSALMAMEKYDIITKITKDKEITY